MKKLIALLLAAVMLLSMTACGGSAEPVETAPATTEAPTTAPTEALTEEPTEAPTEAPRVIPTDFVAVDPATLPEPIPVEEQLQSEDTQTVTLGSLEEYEDLLWSLGFEEVRLVGTHKSIFGTDAWCEPVSLTYNDKAFRFDFVYKTLYLDGSTYVDDGWYMYGTKTDMLANVSFIDENDYAKAENYHPFIVTVTDPNFDMENPADIFNYGLENGEEQEVKAANNAFEKEVMNFTSIENRSVSLDLSAIYYPRTGSLYNYVCDAGQEGLAGTSLDQGDMSTVSGISTLIGMYASGMCFHYVPDAA